MPADATAVALNVTAVGGTTFSFLTIWPTGTPLPNVSSVTMEITPPKRNVTPAYKITTA